MSSAQDGSDKPAATATGADRRKSDRRKAAFSVPFDQNLPHGERRVSGDRRRKRFAQWPRVLLGGLPIVVADQTETARVMVDEALQRRGLWRYPAYMTSANGEVTYRCAVDPAERELVMQADAIHADGMPLVFVSRFRCGQSLPERVATTDLFHDVAREASKRGATMYMLGASEDSNRLAVERMQRRYPGLRLVGRRHGYFADEAEEIAVCGEIAALAPDIMWVSMGVPREQAFVVRNRHRLTTVGVIKTSGGLFDFLSGSKPRAPQWMQNLGMEWLWRMALEPRRLGVRYLKTNPYAMYLLLTRSR
ncbi:WecB/TagA/CpsF family glycosyltransferase [Rhodopseudomonas sp. BR0M22]|uniref:WecB/TagA/CpsF family glycosyltransferase n=1 Tax=Rhodopseudomonas sp. BR0M22 TaxID=2269369 RepID=UPI0013E083FD|nr:WecB/TagA/CpsF family glycosyltransferase [Rhodopseudomonas sp. BR0M22]MCD0420474.1 WecB/TagA/CpsF family glycosyltransferase [Rubrivivax sp. JA1024]NEW93464.1 glycosyltransferase [Rhodopseudomonas sp. BR0M22]